MFDRKNKSKLINTLASVAFITGLAILSYGPLAMLYYIGWMQGDWGAAIPMAAGLALAGGMMIEESTKL